MVGRTIMVVDDQRAVRETLKFVLTRAGYRVIDAESAQSAIILAASEAIDAALIDVHMPRMNGFEACDRLRVQAEQGGRSIRMWLMTGAADKDVERRAIECGTLGLLRKPFALSNLYETLERGFASPIPKAVQPRESSATPDTADGQRSVLSWNGLKHADVGP